MLKIAILTITLTVSGCTTISPGWIDGCFPDPKPKQKFNVPDDSLATKAEYREVAIARTGEVNYAHEQYRSAERCVIKNTPSKRGLRFW